MEHLCKNCGNNFNGKYCNNCGQKSDTSRFTFKHIIEESFHAFTHADKSFVNFMVKLVKDPGTVAYNYIVAGKRKQYFNPFTFFIVITAINAFVEGSDLNLKEKLFHFNNEYGHIFNIYSKILSLVVIPVIGFALWLLHLKNQRLRYSEYTVFSMLLWSLFSMVEILVHAVNYCFTLLRHSPVSIEDNLIYLTLSIAYIGYANFRFDQKLETSSLLKSLLAGISFFVVLFAVQLFIVYAIINGFRGVGSFEMYGVKIS